MALDVELGGDGVWGAGDYVVFYGEALESKYTMDNVYWLTYGKAPGLRMSDTDGTPGSGITPVNYPEIKRLDGGGYYWQNEPGFGDKERFFWARLRSPAYSSDPNSPKWTTTVAMAAPSTSTVLMRVSFYGANSSSTINPDHHVVVKVNGVSVGDIYFDGISWYTAEIPVPAGVFSSSLADNTLEFSVPRDLGQASDLVFIETITLEYDNTFVAYGDMLSFKFDESGTWLFQVNGFSSDQVAAYDITNTQAPSGITGLVLVGEGPYSVQFQANVSTNKKYWTGTPDALKVFFRSNRIPHLTCAPWQTRRTISSSLTRILPLQRLPCGISAPGMEFEQ